MAAPKDDTVSMIETHFPRYQLAVNKHSGFLCVILYVIKPSLEVDTVWPVLQLAVEWSGQGAISIIIICTANILMINISKHEKETI